MSTDQLIVTLLSLLLAAAIAWFFGGPRRGGYRAPVTSGGYHKALILVKGSYNPDIIVVQHGRPVRLLFRREETAACSEMVILPDFGKSARLPAGEVVPIEFVPLRPGEYEFTCQMGMLRGKLIVE